MGLNVYMEVLEKERSNQELTAITLEILVAVLSSDDDNTDDDELGERLAEVIHRLLSISHAFICRCSVILGHAEETSFYSIATCSYR